MKVIDRLNMSKKDITESKKIEENLLTSELQYKQLVENANSLILEVDNKGKVTFINKFAEKFFGYKKKEIIGKSVVGTIMLKRLSSIAKKVCANPKKYSQHEHINVTKDGREVFIAWTNKPILKNGKCVGVIRIGNDITERKKVEEKLRETTDYLERLFNHANAPIIVWDKNFRITRFNHAFEHLTGWTVKDIIGKKLHILLPKESRKESLSKIAKTSAGDYWRSVELSILRKDGSVRPVLWNSANILDKDALTIIATIAQGQEITEQKQVEEALKESEQKFRELYEGSQDAYVRVDMNYQIKEFNSSLPKMLGYSEKELLSKNYLIFASAKKWHPLEEKIFKNQVIKRSYSDLYEKEFIRKDGTIFPAQIRAYLIKDKDGNPTGIWGFIRNTTEIKEAEAKIRIYAKELERRVKERTKELNKVNQQLLERVNELERFHDLTVGRELKMIELKKEIKKLETETKIEDKKMNF